MLEKWISIFGRMKILHSDRGAEFVNEERTILAEYLDVKQSLTAASSPNQNGCNERNHAIVDRMMEKMLFADPEITPETALCWALNAKNTLENYQGFSPVQIVFGETPELPAIYAAGPSGFKEVKMAKAMGEQISALHLGREAFIQCESDRVLKKILKTENAELVVQDIDVPIEKSAEWLHTHCKLVPSEKVGEIKLRRDGKLTGTAPIWLCPVRPTAHPLMPMDTTKKLYMSWLINSQKISKSQTSETWTV